MITLEQVEKLREKTGVSYEEAKNVLEETGGDLLEAVILLERQHRIQGPASGGYYHSRAKKAEEEPMSGHQHRQNGPAGQSASAKEDSVSFGELVGRFFSWCGKILHAGNINNFEVMKDGRHVLRVPVTVLALLLVFTFWIILPLLIVGLIFGYRYRFAGPDLGKTEVNKAMDAVSDVTLKAVDTVVDAAESFSKDIKKGKGGQAHETGRENTAAGETPDSDR